MSTTTRHLLATVGPHQQLRLSLSWNSTDPFAVVMDMYPPRMRVRWVFAWELLEDGVHAPAGLGDVRIYPVSATRTEIVLDPGVGRSVLQVDTADLVAFLADTWVAEPPPIPDFLDDINWEMAS